jgi:hypothetical protein
MTALLRFLCWSTIAALAIACGGSLTKSAELRGYVKLADGTPVAWLAVAPRSPGGEAPYPSPRTSITFPNGALPWCEGVTQTTG